MPIKKPSHHIVHPINDSSTSLTTDALTTSPAPEFLNLNTGFIYTPASALPQIIFKFVEANGKTIAESGATLTNIFSAASSLSNVELANLGIQSLALTAGIAADLYEPAGIVAIGSNVLAGGAAIAIGREHIKEAQNDAANNGGVTTHDVLNIASDVVTASSDEFGVIDGILNFFPLLKFEAITVSYVNIGLTLAGAGLLVADTKTVGEIETNLQKYIGQLQSVLVKYGPEISSVVGPLGSTLLTNLSTALSTTGLVLDSTASDIIPNAVDAIDKISSSSIVALNIFGNQGVSVPDITETTTAGSVTTTTSDGSVKLISSSDFDQYSGDASAQFQITGSADSETETVDENSFLNGARDLSVSGIDMSSTAAQGNTVSQEISTNASGLVVQQTLFDGITIETPASNPTELETDSTGAAIAIVPSMTVGDEITIKSLSNGSDGVFIGDGISAPQLLLDANYKIRNRDEGSLSIIASNGIINVTTYIGGDDGFFVINSEQSNPNVVQTFSFSNSNEVLEVDDPKTFSGTISNFQIGDNIILGGLSSPEYEGLTATATISSNGVLSVMTNDGQVASVQLDPSKSYANDYLQPYFEGSDFDNTGAVVVRAFSKPTGTGVETTMVDVPVDGKITYNVKVSNSPTNIDFSPIRAGQNEDVESAPIVFSYVGGHPDPDGLPGAEITSGITDGFSLVNKGELGPGHYSTTLLLESGSDTPEDYINLPVPVAVSYDEVTAYATIYVNQAIYAPAIGTFEVGPKGQASYDFGVLHVGQTSSVSVTLSNSATGIIADTLISTSQEIGAFKALNGVDLESGQTGNVTLQVNSENTGIISTDQTIFGLISHDTALPDEAAASASEFSATATIYNYAQPELINSQPTEADGSVNYPILDGPTGGTLNQTGENSYNLDFGVINQSDQTNYLGNIIVENAAPSTELSDELSGLVSVSGAGYTNNVEIGALQDATGGSYIEIGNFSPDLTSLGANTLTVTYSPTSVDTSSTTDLPDITLTVTDDVVMCFVSGTHIRTAGADVRIEDVVVGDVLQTKLTQFSVVKWIGRRQINCRRHPAPQTVWPVRVSAHAFARDQPHSDVWLSPEHSVLVDGILIPVRYLINGATIVQEPWEEVTYWHVEFDCHDVIWAEGLPCESYLEAGHRSAFATDRGTIQMLPDFSFDQTSEAIWEARGIAPLRIEGSIVTQAATKLRHRAKRLGHTVEVRVKSAKRAPPFEANFAKLFDLKWYLGRERDVAAARVDAAKHYIEWGRKEGRMPCDETKLLHSLQVIDPMTVVFTMSDVVRAGVDPVLHFCTEGWKERRNPNPYFDTGWYLDTHSIGEELNPLMHYLLLGENQGLAPSRHFNPTWYRERYAIGAMESPLVHYLQHRRSQCVSPLPSFDVIAYCKEYSGTLPVSRDPYAHYLAIGQFAETFKGSMERAAA